MDTESETTFHRFTVEVSGGRLDRHLVAVLPDLSRTAIQRLITEGQVTVNGLPARPAYKVRTGDEICVRIPTPRPTTLEAEAIPLDVLYEDEDIIVVNKPPGIIVHPGAGHPSGTLVNALLAHCPDLRGVGGELRPGIVHRLDRETSGVLVVAKCDRALRVLQRQFKARTVRKRYVALVVGHVPQVDGLIDAPIARHPVHRKKMAVSVHGKPARTRWHILDVLQDEDGHAYTLVEVILLTGRTHQIRVHFAWLGYPVVGDRVYGFRHATLTAPRHFLHARDLTLRHPTTGEVMTFSAPLPDDLRAVLARLTPK